MLQSKLLEVRDNFTRIDIIATKMVSNDLLEHSILCHNGYSSEYPAIIVTRIETGESSNDPFKWHSTMQYAHKYIRDHFDEIPNLWTVDVETIHNRKSDMKVPERYNSMQVITFEINPLIEESEFYAVASILREEYGLESAKYVGDRNISIRKNEISKLGIKFYEVLNEYLRVQ